MYQPSTKTPKKVFQKGGFCNAKTPILEKANRGFRKTKTPIPLKETNFLLIHKLNFLIHIAYTRLQFNYFLLHFA